MKTIIIILFFLIILAIIVAIVGLTNWGLGTMEKYVDDNSKETWAPDYHWYIAGAYFYTFRENKALDSYKDFILKYPDDARLPDAYYRVASCYQEMNMKSEAANAFTEFADKYPDNPNADEARKRAGLIRYAH